MTLREAAEAGMTGCAMFVWPVDDKYRRIGVNHLEVRSGYKTVCGLETSLDQDNGGWMYRTISFPLLWARVEARENICARCLRGIAKYDFSPGKEPSVMQKEPSVIEEAF